MCKFCPNKGYKEFDGYCKQCYNIHQKDLSYEERFFERFGVYYKKDGTPIKTKEELLNYIGMKNG